MITTSKLSSLLFHTFEPVDFYWSGAQNGKNIINPEHMNQQENVERHVSQ